MKGGISSTAINFLYPDILKIMDSNIKLHLKAAVLDLLYDIQVPEIKSIQICQKLIAAGQSSELIRHIWGMKVNADDYHSISVRNAFLDSWWSVCKGFFY
jgi:hypothetical protein